MVVIEITSLNHDSGNGLEKAARERGVLTMGLVRRGKDLCDSVFLEFNQGKRVSQKRQYAMGIGGLGCPLPSGPGFNPSLP